jgi:3-hydroxy acid dehydrogenase/malonic semialdehyde reductase
MDLTHKTVLITGASSGIGYACALAAARLGANLLLVARREDKLEDCVNACVTHYGVKVETRILDITDRYAVQTVLSDPALLTDILINNAGLAAGADPFQAGNLDDYEQMINTNIKGLLYVTHAILPGMLARNTGHIINIGSIAGHEVYPNGAVYCATKHAVNAFSRGLKMDLNHSALRVTSIDPGMVETEFSLVRYHGDAERAKAVYQGMTPLTPEDVADAVMYAATRPPHVNVSEMLLLPTDQASTTQVHRHTN